MERANIKAASQICQFRSLGDRAQAIVIQNLRKDTDYSDAPEEFKGSLHILCGSPEQKRVLQY